MDNPSVDLGGSIVPKQNCTHVFSALNTSLNTELNLLQTCLSCEPLHAAENWVCLTCGKTFCSRYVSSHQEKHFMDTFIEDSTNPHCLALSCQDLSVWCYCCNEYIKHDRLLPLLIKAESAKFGTPEKTFLMRSTATRFNVGLAFAEEAGNESLHAHPTKFSLERPCRATAVMDQLGSEQLVAKMKFISGEDFPPTSAAFPSMSVDEAVLLVHSKEYFQSLLECADTGETGQQQRAALSALDMYVTPSTPSVALANARALLALTNAVVVDPDLDRGFCVSRPPGHHASRDGGGGFCIINNIAIAAAYAKAVFGFTRIMILDFDIHHGNGTQSIFYEDNCVLHVSIHKQHLHDGCHFAEEGLENWVGNNAGLGYNVNVPLSAGYQPGELDSHPGGLGDADYALVMNHIVCPLILEFQPEIVFVAAGFDASLGDGPLPTGGYCVTPNGYAAITRLLLQAVETNRSPLNAHDHPKEDSASSCKGAPSMDPSASASGARAALEGKLRLVYCLEGGYDLAGLCQSCASTVRSLIAGSDTTTCGSNSGGAYEGEVSPCPAYPPHPSTLEVILRVKNTLAAYWRCFGS